MSAEEEKATNTRRASRKLTPQKLADRGRTVMLITKPEILGLLDLMLADVKNTIECRRRPGIQVGLDALLQFWFLSDPLARETFLKLWKTPVVGYPNSVRKNPGQFARLKDVENHPVERHLAEVKLAEAQRQIDRTAHGVNDPSIDPGAQPDVTPKELDRLKGVDLLDAASAPDKDDSDYDTETYDPGRLD